MHLAPLTNPRILVVVPVYNRAHVLGETLESVRRQTYPNWRCLVIDDGSTDGSAQIVEEFFNADPRFMRIGWSENRGGVFANEVGMGTAASLYLGYSIWTRLGSDDLFAPRKLELDAAALSSGKYGACYGPYRHIPATSPGELNVPADARAALLEGHFAASWANMAVRSDILRILLHRHGQFCDPRLRNMEDYLFNLRLAAVSQIAWRAGEKGGTRIVVGATSPDQVPFPVEPDAEYRLAMDGATYSEAMRDYRVSDAHMTEVVHNEDHAKARIDPQRFGVLDLPKPTVEVIG